MISSSMTVKSDFQYHYTTPYLLLKRYLKSAAYLVRTLFKFYYRDFYQKNEVRHERVNIMKRRSRVDLTVLGRHELPG